MKYLPISLIYSRVVIGCTVLLLGLLHPAYYRHVIITLIVIGLITDILDGIIARAIGVSTEKLRRLDSGIDMVFWILVFAAALVVAPSFFRQHYLPVAILLGMEALTYVLSYIRFRKEVATHAILSKVWALSICATIVQVIATGNSGLIFSICYYLGMITRGEIFLILLILKEWTNDVPSLYHAVRLRNGREIKRSKWFNG